MALWILVDCSSALKDGFCHTFTRFLAYSENNGSDSLKAQTNLNQGHVANKIEPILTNIKNDTSAL